MILDQLIVLFGEQGGKDVLKAIRDIDKAASKSIKSFAKVKAKAIQETDEAIQKSEDKSNKHYQVRRRADDDHVRTYKKYRKYEDDKRKRELYYEDLIKKEHSKAETQKQKKTKESADKARKLREAEADRHIAYEQTVSKFAKKKEKEEIAQLEIAEKLKQAQLKAQDKAEVELEKKRIRRRKEEIRYKELGKRMAAKEQREAQVAKTQAEEAHNEALKEKILLIGKLGATALIVGKSMQKMYNFVGNVSKSGIAYVGRYGQSGLSSSIVQGFDEALRLAGGVEGEGQSTLASLSGKIGAMRYGDTGLVQTLGKYGIGGIHARSSEADVIRAVARKAQGMDAYAQQAMFQELGFSDAMQNMIRQGKVDEALKGKTPITVAQEQINAVEEQIKASKAATQAQNDIAKYLAPISNFLSKIAQTFPKTTEAAKGAIPLLGGATSLWAIPKLLDYLKNGGTMTGLLSNVWSGARMRGGALLSSMGDYAASSSKFLRGGLGLGMLFATSNAGSSMELEWENQRRLKALDWSLFNNVKTANATPLSTVNTGGDTTNNNQTYNNTTNYNVQGEPFMGGQSGMDILMGDLQNYDYLTNRFF